MLHEVNRKEHLGATVLKSTFARLPGFLNFFSMFDNFYFEISTGKTFADYSFLFDGGEYVR